MSDDSAPTRRTLYLWALGLNVVAWGGYLVLTKVMGIDFETIRQRDYIGPSPNRCHWLFRYPRCPRDKES